MSADIRLVAAAGRRIGHGHLARALSLAEAGWPDDITVELEVDEAVLSPTELDRAARARLRFVRPGAPAAAGTVVVIDRPDPTGAIEAYPTNRTVVFDDVNGFTGRADLVVQPSAERWLGPGHASRVLAGYRWVPIGAAWRQRMAAASTAQAPEPRETRPAILVCFGGSDPHDVTARLGPVVTADPRWSTTIVVGHGYAGARPPDIDIRTDAADLPDLVAAADLALISAGTIKFEVAAMGRAALLVGVADDQLDVGPPFASTGAARWIGDGRIIEPESAREAITNVVADRPALEAMGRTARSVIDGRGGDRLAAEIAALRR